MTGEKGAGGAHLFSNESKPEMTSPFATKKLVLGAQMNSKWSHIGSFHALQPSQNGSDYRDREGESR